MPLDESESMGEASSARCTPLTGTAMSAEQVAQVHPGKPELDRQVRDPAGLSLGEIRAIRADIDARVRALLAELHPAGASR